MVNNEASPLQVVLYEGEGTPPIDDDLKFEVFSGLLDRGYAGTRIGTEGNSPKPVTDSLLVLGNFGDSAPEVEDASNQVSVETRDVTAMDADAVFNLVDEFKQGKEMNQPPSAGGKSWKPWFPVIDYDRCTNCMQCLSFCLFDVYGVDDDQKIQVQNQDNCKTNCPACSRVCPEVAIMFPKYEFAGSQRSGQIQVFQGAQS